MSTITKNEFIKFLIEEDALRFGTFTLKSGTRSPFFINLGDICSGSALQFLGKALAENITKYFGGADILFGPPYKGIALISATAIAYQELYGQTIYTCYNRKEAKAHGEKGMFVGRMPQNNDRIIVIDDVLTTGGTKIGAIQLVESTFDVKIAGVVVAVDRRLREADSGLGDYSLSCIVDLPDIVAYLKETNDPNAPMMQDFYEGNYE